MSAFGWNYPPGAENDPNAPWNQMEDGETCTKCGECIDEDEPSIAVDGDDVILCLSCAGKGVCEKCGGIVPEDEVKPVKTRWTRMMWLCRKCDPS